MLENFDEKSTILACFFPQLPSACRFFAIGFRFEFQRKIINFCVPFDAITCGVSIFSWFNCCSSFDEKSSILVCIAMQLASTCQSFCGSYARIVVRARVSTRASYAPLRPLVVTASASALRDPAAATQASRSCTLADRHSSSSFQPATLHADQPDTM